MSIKSFLQEQIKTAVKDLGIDVTDVDLSHPPSAAMGDYSTNVAMIIFSNPESGIRNQEWNSPRDLAEAIIEKLRAKGEEQSVVEKIEIAGPGFINFFLKPEYFLEALQKTASEGYELQLSTSLTGKKIMVEFTDPNPFKEFHIGHLYSNTVGEAIARLLEASGAEVKRVTYQGDVGLHVAKALWGMKQKMEEERSTLAALQDRSIEDKVKWLGESYALGAAAYEEDQAAKKDIVALNKAVYEGVPAIQELYTTGKQWSLTYFDSIYERLGSNFWKNYFESEAGPVGLRLVREYLDQGVFQESDGAVIFPGEDYGLHTRVFINSLGLPTYEAKELGLAPTKYQDYPYDLSIIVTGNEINEYFKVLLKALSIINKDLAEKTVHISHGMVRLPEGKMSSRTGNVKTGEWLLNAAKERLQAAYPEMAEDTLEKVAVGAVKWALLRSGIGKDITFNLEESVSFEGDSGPYIQYTYARTQSVLEKAQDKEQSAKRKNNSLPSALSSKLEAEEIQLLKLLDRFGEAAKEAGEHYAPNVLTNYLFDLSQTFNLFYQKQRILDPESVISKEERLRNPEGVEASPTGSLADARDDSMENIRAFRVALTQATGNVLRSGLNLLGIQAPEKM